MNDTIEVFLDDAGQWRWHRQAPNGRIIATSGESFDSHFNARRAATRANLDVTPPDEPDVA